ncbi:MAG: globin domain-containing protein [Chitinophagaceae bacterium]
MQLTSEQVRLIRETWEVLRGVNPHLVADVFYRRLFLEYPGLRRLFPDEMDHQYTKLMDMLNVLVERLDQLDDLADEIADLGHRHVHYGAKAEHYKAVAKALLWTLQQALGDSWNKEVEQAWTDCYQQLAGQMMGTAAG